MISRSISFFPKIPDWELVSKFDPIGDTARKRNVVWIDIKGDTVKSLSHITEVEDILSQDDFDFSNLVFRYPKSFVAASLSHNVSAWKRLGTPSFILDWIENGVDILPMFKTC